MQKGSPKVIGFLKGTIAEKTPDSIILNVSGVGYEVHVPLSSICALPTQGSEASLYIHTYVREDAIRLFGFSSLFDRKVFEALISVSSVGPKLALALLGPLDGESLCQVILSANVALLTTIPGVGAKTAERLVLELKTKIQKLVLRQSANSTISTLNKETGSLFSGKMGGRQVIEDLRSALLNLGYKDKQINQELTSVETKWKDGEEIVLEATLKHILKNLSGHVFQSYNDSH